MDDALRMAMRDSMQQGQLDEEEKKAKALEAVKRSKSQNRPSILDIAPAEQDATRVGGLMEDIEVPGGEFADMDIMAEQMVNMGFPPGLIEDFFRMAKENPAKYDADIKKMTEMLKSDPETLKRLQSSLGQQAPGEEGYPEDLGEGMGDMGAF